jgi:DNA-binding Lrp family transcriptional regulator
MRGLQQRVLAAIAEAAPKALTYRALREASHLSPPQVRDAVRQLAAKGLVRRPKPGTAQLLPAGRVHLAAGQALSRGPQKPRPMGGDSLRARLWRALRIRVRVTLFELLQLAARGDEANAKANAVRYLGALGRSGYVADRRQPGQRAMDVCYILLRNTGPLPPQWNKRQRRVFDPNTREVTRVA